MKHCDRGHDMVESDRMLEQSPRQKTYTTRKRTEEKGK